MKKNKNNKSNNSKFDNKNDLDLESAGTKHLQKPKKRSLSAILITWIIIGIAVVVFIIAASTTGHVIYLKWVFYDALVDNILAVPSILIGLITFLGYLLQKKKWYDALAGGIKAIVGYLVLQIGAFILTGISKPLMIAFGKEIGSSAILLDPYVGWTQANAALGNLVSMVSYVVLIGLFINILLVVFKRITNVRSINVTGHIMFQQAATLTAILYFMMFIGINNSSVRQLSTIIIGGISIGLYWGVFSNLAYAPTQVVTKNAGFTVGHQQMLGVWVAYQAGKLFALKNKKVRSAEELKLPKGMKIFHDNIFSSSVLMLIFFGALFIILFATNQNAFNNLVTTSIGGMNQFLGKFWLIQIFGLSLEIVASLQILMQGARMFVVELQKSFIGISNKLIPGAVVAIDIAGTFAFGEKSVVFGFLAGAIGNFIGIALVIILGQVAHLQVFNVVIMVGFIAMFFDNGAVGLYANASGGWKACITLPFISGILVVLGSLLAVKMTNGIFLTGYIGMWDWNTIWAIFFTVLHFANVDAAPYVIILLIIACILIAQFTTTEPNKETLIKKSIIQLLKQHKGLYNNQTIKKQPQQE